MGPGPTTRQDLESRFRELRSSDDPRLRRSLIEDGLPLARHVARRFSDRGESLDDLIQVACVALVKAVDRFDPNHNLAFSTYATHTMVGELKRHFRDRGWSLRPPRSVQGNYLALKAAVATLSQERRRSPTIAELAGEVGITEEKALEALEAGRRHRRATSLDAPAPSDGQDTDRTLSDCLGAEDVGFASREDWVAVVPGIRALPERQRVILGLRFFTGLPQAEIARRVGVSQIQVSRLLARSLANLRARVA